MRLRSFCSLVVLCVIGAAACGSKAPVQAGVKVTGIDLGRSLAADKRIADATDTFKPADTVYASIGTDGTGTATLRTSWTYAGGQTVNESSQTISPSGPARTEFHISNSDGWPTGRYRST